MTVAKFGMVTQNFTDLEKYVVVIIIIMGFVILSYQANKNKKII
jgi:hypothetical protein